MNTIQDKNDTIQRSARQHRNAVTVTRSRRWTTLLSPLVFALFAGGCALEGAYAEDLAPTEAVESTEEALSASSSTRAGFTCEYPNGTCQCDKRIENDCEDMMWHCDKGDLDRVAECINGWGTSACWCKVAAAKPAYGNLVTSGGVSAPALVAIVPSSSTASKPKPPTTLGTIVTVKPAARPVVGKLPTTR